MKNYTVQGGSFQKAFSLGDMDALMDLQVDAQRGKTPQALYEIVSYYFWCARVRANNIASIEYGIYPQSSTEDTEENEQDYDIDLAPFLWLISMWLDLCGGAYMLKLTNRTGVVDFQMLNPNTMKIITKKDGSGEILRFEQRVGQHKKIYKPEEMVYFRTFDPKQDIMPGVSSGQVGDLSGEIIRHTNEWAGAFFRNGAFPAIILETESQISPGERAKLKANWNKFLQGVKNAWELFILRRGIKVIQVGQPVKDLAMPELTQAQKEQITAAFDLPIGYTERNANRAEREWLQYELYIDHLIPFAQTVIVPTLNEQLFNPLGLRFAFDIQSIEAIARVELQKAQQGAAVIRETMLPAYIAKTVKLSEFRAVLNTVLGNMEYPTLDDDYSELIQLPEEVGETEETTGEAVSATGELSTLPTATPTDEKSLKKNLTIEARQDLRKWARKCQQRGKAADFNSTAIPVAFKSLVDAAIDTVGHEKAFSFLKASDAQTRRLEKEMQAKIQPILNNYKRDIIWAIHIGETVDYEAMAAALRAKILPLITGIVTEEALRTADNVGVSFDPAVIGIGALEWARGYTFKLVGGLTDTTRKVVRSAITSFIETPGMTQADLQASLRTRAGKDEFGQLIEPAFSEYRAKMIGITEVTRAYSHATTEIQKKLAAQGVVMSRIWQTRNDELVCFRENVGIETKLGTMPISSAKVGWPVFTRLGLRRVMAVNKRNYTGPMCQIEHELGELECTDMHPIWVCGRGWVRALEIDVGDVLQMTKYQSAVIGVHFIDVVDLPVYNLQVEDDPVFFANGVLVHNCPICGPLNGQPESVWAGQFPDGPPAHPRCRCGATLSAMSDDFHRKEAQTLAEQRIAYLEEMGLTKEAAAAREALVAGQLTTPQAMQGDLLSLIQAATAQDLTADELEMYQDAFSLSEESFATYAEKLGLPGDIAELSRRFFETTRAQNRQEAKVKWDDRAARALHDEYSPKTDFQFLGLKLSQQARRKVGKSLNDALGVLDRHGVSFNNQAGVDEARAWRDTSTLARILDSSPAIAGVAHDNVRGVEYRQHKDANHTAAAEYDPITKRIILYPSESPLPGAFWVHEIGHSAEEYSELGAINAAGFGQGHIASMYGDIDPSEDFAELFVAVTGGAWDQEKIREWMPGQYDYLMSVVPGLEGE